MVDKEIIVNETQKQIHNVRYTKKVERNLFHLLCDYENFWFSHNLLYDSYVRSKEFNNLGVKILYFQAGAFELDTDSEEIWKTFDFSDSRRFADYRRVNFDLM